MIFRISGISSPFILVSVVDYQYWFGYISPHTGCEFPIERVNREVD